MQASYAYTFSGKKANGVVFLLFFMVNKTVHYQKSWKLFNLKGTRVPEYKVGRAEPEFNTRRQIKGEFF